MTDSGKSRPERRAKGFARTGTLLQSRIRRAGESRGFAVTRLLTHWAEIVGEELARTARPVKVGYGREGFGATLTVLATGANAPMVEMQKERIRERVNACYGYAAISKVRITQTAASGFAEGRPEFGHAPASRPPAASTGISREARTAAAPIRDERLRRALEALGANILSRDKS